MTLWEMYSFGQLPYGEMSGGEVSIVFKDAISSIGGLQNARVDSSRN